MRGIGFLLSALMAGSAALPWIDNQSMGSWSLLDGVKALLEANRDLSFTEILENLPNPVPGVDSDSATTLSIAAFAISFPLAAAFALAGLLGYYTKLMAFVLGGIPVGLVAYAGVAVFRLQNNGIIQQLPADFFERVVAEAQANLGAGLPTYLFAGALLFLAGLFGPSRR